MAKHGSRKKSHHKRGSRGRYHVDLGGSIHLGGGGLGGAAFRPVEQMQSTAFAQMQAAYNKKQQIEMAGLNAEQRKLQREMGEKMGDMQEQQAEQRARSEKEMRKRAAENAEKFAEQRIDMQKKQRHLQREMQKKATEQRDKLEAQQLDMAKQAADQQLKMAEQWAQNAAAMGAVAFNIPAVGGSPIVGPRGESLH